MSMPKRQLVTPLPDTSTTSLPAEIDPNETKPDALPRGSTLLVETALAYTRKIEEAETLEQAREFARVVAGQLEYLKAKIDRRKGIA